MFQHSSFRLNKLPVAAAMAFLCLLGGSAHADDAKNYPGEMCNSTGSDANLVHYWGRVKNNTNNTMSVQCPVIRDETTSSTSYGTIWVLDQNDTYGLSCTMGMIVPTTDDTAAVSGFFSSRSSTWASSTVPGALSNFASLANVANGHLMITCSLPPIDDGKLSGIVSYRVSENN